MTKGIRKSLFGILAIAILALSTSCSDRKGVTNDSPGDGGEPAQHQINYSAIPLNLDQASDPDYLNLKDDIASGYDQASFERLYDYWTHEERVVFWTQAALSKANPNGVQAPLLSPSDASESEGNFSTQINLLQLTNRDLSKMDLNSYYSSVIEAIPAKGADIFDLKNEGEQIIEQDFSPANRGLVYNSSATTLYDLTTTKKLQSFSGSMNLAMLALNNWKQSQFRARNFVFIHTPSHIQFGYMEKNDDMSFDLYAVESTVSGKGRMYYGPAAELKGDILVTDAELFLLSQIFKRRIKSDKSRKSLRNWILNETAVRYKIDLNASSAHNKANLDLRLHNSSLFSIEGPKQVKVPNQDQVRSKADELIAPSGFSQKNLSHLSNRLGDLEEH